MAVTKQSFIRGTMILFAAGILNRILGFIPRITLPRVIGAEGIGIYQMGWPFLSVILTIITGGIPVAIAKLIAEAEAEKNETRIRSILRISLAITISPKLHFYCYLYCRSFMDHFSFTDRFTRLLYFPMYESHDTHYWRLRCVSRLLSG